MRTKGKWEEEGRKTMIERTETNFCLCCYVLLLFLLFVVRGCIMVYRRFCIEYDVSSRPSLFRAAYDRAFGLLWREGVCQCPEVLVLSFLEAERLAEAPPALPVSSD